MSQSFKPPIKIDVDSSGTLVVTPLTTTPPPPPPPPPVPTPTLFWDAFDATWEAGKNVGGTPGTTGSVSIDNQGILDVSLTVTDGNDSNFGYASAQRGTFPWGSTVGTPLPSNITKIRTTVLPIAQSFQPGHSRLHYYVALYYKCATAFNGWFDTQVRIEYVDGLQMPSTAPPEVYGGPSDPGVQADGYATIITSTDFSIDVEALFTAATQAWGIDPSTPHSLAGLEIGQEGFFSASNAEWEGVTLVLGSNPVPPPPPPVTTPVITTAAKVIANTFPTRDWNTAKHVYAADGTPAIGQLVTIKNCKLSNVANGSASGDCNDPSCIPPLKPGTWCDSTADADDGTGIVHVEIDQVDKSLGIAPQDWPSNGTLVDITGYTFYDGEGGGTPASPAPGGWEIHPIMAWTLSSVSPPPPPPPTSKIDQIVFVILENTGLPTTLANAPFLVQLANQNALSQNWAHLGHPSEPNYVGIAFGDTLGVNNDGQTPALPPPTWLDLIKAAGKTYKVIQNGSRAQDHNGFLLESPDISNTIAGDTPDVIAAAKAGTNFIWFTPSDNQNAHDNGIVSCDQFMASWIPQLLQSMSPNGLLVITFDESFDDSIVYTCFAGPSAKKGYSSSTAYSHYSFGKLIETIFGGTGLRNSDTAPAPTEFLQ